MMEEEDDCSNEPLLQTEEKRSKQRWLWRRLIPLVALLSFTISTIIALVFYFILFSQSSLAEHGYTSTMLPGLKTPPLGSVLKSYNPDPFYTIFHGNQSRDMWMDLFPRGMGYIQMKKVKELGAIPDFIQSVNTDESGRFCVAVFHQLHCLYLIFEEYSQALQGQIKKPSGHTVHCFDYLRQSIMCAADSNLEPFRSRFDGMRPGDGVDGIGSIHQCRKYEDVFAWADRFRYNDDGDAESFSGSAG